MLIHSPWRTDFPGILALEAEGQTYLDSAATAQKPQAMIAALTGYYQHGAANVHRASICRANAPPVRSRPCVRKSLNG